MRLSLYFHHMPSTQQRLAAVEAVTKGLKGSYAPVIQLGLQNILLPWVPASVSQQVCKDVFERHTLVFSNVPGMTERLSGLHV
jgi:hypothetical protein